MKLFLRMGTEAELDWLPLAAAMCRNTLMQITPTGETAYGIAEWKGDHYVLKYSRDKTDQTGEKTIPRSMYSNPVNPV